MRAKYIQKKDLEKLRGNLGYDWAIYQLMAETGIRVGDAVRVRTSDISLEEGHYFLRITAQKTGKDLCAELSQGLAAKLLGRGNGYCFVGRDGIKPVTRQTVWRRLKTAAKATHVQTEGTSPHSLRKCFAVSKMRADGLDAVQKALQHSNSEVTRLYAYSDTFARADSDEPIRWRDLGIICGYLLDRLNEK